jgi:superfamily II DNA/RNA helicase
MSKRPNESEEDRKARKKAKKQAKREKKEAAAATAAKGVTPAKEEDGTATTKKRKKDNKTNKNNKDTIDSTTVTDNESSSSQGGSTTDNNQASSSSSVITPASSSSSSSSSSSKDEQHLEFKTFEEAPFSAAIQKALQDAGFTEPSPIQKRAWPVVLQGQDLIAVAKTGSGKTLGFLLPIFHLIHALSNVEKVVKTTGPLCLVLAPTRELAIQIHKECVKFGGGAGGGQQKAMMIRSECVYGGTNVGGQIQQLKQNNPHVIIATPGRLCDMLERKAVNLSKCQFCILDESDRMLDMGFEPQLKQIMPTLPKERQTLFFTATWPQSVRRVAQRFLRGDGHTTEVFIGNSNSTLAGGNSNNNGELEANKAVTQTFIEAQDDVKDKKLYELLCSVGDQASLVIFANTKRRVDYIANIFWQEGFSTCAIHGDKPQHERDASLKKFMTKECAILVATDVAARGLDIKGVTHVVNFDMARDVESYVHRIGRTGRAGELGEAVTFWNPDYDKECSPALIKIARDAGQVVPPFLAKYEKQKSNKQWKVIDAAKAAAILLTTGQQQS